MTQQMHTNNNVNELHCFKIFHISSDGNQYVFFTNVYTVFVTLFGGELSDYTVICSRTDSKSIMRMKSGQMFAKEDLIRGRKLLHDGALQLKNSAGRLKGFHRSY